MTAVRLEPVAPADGDETRGLVRAITLPSAVLLVVTNVIGSAIFLTPGMMAQTLPSAPLLLLAWATGGVIALCGALTFAELGTMFPRSGGLYVFLEEAFGPLVAFLYGWAGLLVMLTGATAAVAVGFATYFAYFFPELSPIHIIITAPLPWGVWRVSSGQLVAAASILAIGAVNYVGVKSGNRLQAALTVIKIAAIVAIPAVALAMPGAALSSATNASIPHPLTAFGVVLIGVMWAYEGWYYLPFCAGEIADPARTLPRALLIGITAIVVIYLLVNVAYIRALTIDEMQGVERIAEKAMTTLLGAAGAGLVAATVIVSTLACNAASVLAISRAGYAMAVDGLFVPAAAALHPRFRTPHVAIAMTSGWSALLTITGTYEELYTWVTFASAAFGALGGLAHFRLRRIQPNTPRPYRTWGYPVVPAVFVTALVWLVVNTMAELPRESLGGVTIVALGVPAYWYCSRRTQSSSRSRGTY